MSFKLKVIFILPFLVTVEDVVLLCHIVETPLLFPWYLANSDLHNAWKQNGNYVYL